MVETIPGWAHDVTNVGSDVMIALLWANEVFDPHPSRHHFVPGPMKRLRVVTVVGTRPEIIRLSRVMAKLDRTAEHVRRPYGPELRPGTERRLL